MKIILYIIAGLILLAVAPHLILGLIFTAGIYYFLYAMFKGIIGGSGGSGGGSSSHDDGYHWHGTGNPHM
jgi:hypothetical protein